MYLPDLCVASRSARCASVFLATLLESLTPGANAAGQAQLLGPHEEFVACQGQRLTGRFEVASFTVPADVVVWIDGDLSIESCGAIVVDGLLAVDRGRGAAGAPSVELRSQRQIEVRGEIQLADGADARRSGARGGDGGSLLLEGAWIASAHALRAGDGGRGGAGGRGGDGGRVLVLGPTEGPPFTIHGGAGGPGGHGAWNPSGVPGAIAGAGGGGGNGGHALFQFANGANGAAGAAGAVVIGAFGVAGLPGLRCGVGGVGAAGGAAVGGPGGVGGNGADASGPSGSGGGGGTGGMGGNGAGANGGAGGVGGACCSPDGPGGNGAPGGVGGNATGGVGGRGGNGGAGVGGGAGGYAGAGGTGGHGLGGDAGRGGGGGDGSPPGQGVPGNPVFGLGVGGVGGGPGSPGSGTPTGAPALPGANGFGFDGDPAAAGLVGRWCPGVSQVVAVDPIGGPLPDLATVSFPLSITAAGAYVIDVDVHMNLQHTYAADLDMTLTSPMQTQAVISTDNGGANDNVFAGTLWDDSALDLAPTDALYANNVTQPRLNFEGGSDVFRGENPNGVWTLTITDDFAADVGHLASWTLTVRTLNVAPNEQLYTFSSAPRLALVDQGTVVDQIYVDGFGQFVSKVEVYTQITHTFAADLDLRLVSPAGSAVTLTTDNGGANVDVFNGTLWTDRDNARRVTDYAYTSFVAASPLSPEASLAALLWEVPNGAWRLQITDDAALDVGTLESWELRLTMRASSTPPASYCQCGVTTNACCASIAADVDPSASFAHACQLSVTNVEGQKNGIFFYGLAPHATAWAAGSSSVLCVKAPTQRTPHQLSGGTAGACNGAFALDWNAFQQAHPTALGQPWLAGDDVYVQAWFRDPSAVKTTNLSNAVRLTYQP